MGYIITNPRYKGDALLQKTFTENFPFKERRNYGERDMYYVKNANPPIVSAEVFDKANNLLSEKRKVYCVKRINSEYTLSKMIYCKECKTLFRRKSNKNLTWVCRKHDIGADVCPTPQIAETAIYEGFVQVYNRLLNNIENILTPMLSDLTVFREQKLSLQSEFNNINEQIAKAIEQVLILNQLNADGCIEPADFIQRKNELNAKIARLGYEKKLMNGSDVCRKLIRQTERLIRILKDKGAIGTFDEKVFGQIVRKVWVDRDRNITYELINNLKLEIEYGEVM